MRSNLYLFVAAMASTVACASTSSLGGGQNAATSCENLGAFPGKSQATSLDAFPQNATEADRTNWKKTMNDRYVSLKSEAVADAQRSAQAAGATHIQYQDAMVTSNPDKTMKGTVNVIAYKCAADSSAPKGTLPANDPIPEQQGSTTSK